MLEEAINCLRRLKKRKWIHTTCDKRAEAKCLRLCGKKSGKEGFLKEHVFLILTFSYSFLLRLGTSFAGQILWVSSVFLLLGESGFGFF